ncbi:hypothetical protein [uncultured Tateyamaria sp.]|uniref:hypothetical protein n=1 Tax=uncultured Tateyamaria sp. TaxID=455651 RepID=UPI002606F3A7|nr:hypothetical protein [uncultured Tateyamaria sp.]
MKFFDFTDPFFAPVWIRVCVVAVCVLWGLFELATGQVVWAVVFFGMGALSGWRFCVNDYDRDTDG